MKKRVECNWWPINIENKIIKKKVLFIDRDGTIIVEPPVTYQVDTVEQIELYRAMDKIRLRYGNNAVLRATGLGKKRRY